jgi:hypothetical protein
MRRNQRLSLKLASFWGIFLLSSLNAEEQGINSDKLSFLSYLSSLENKIENLRSQMQNQQEQNEKAEESLAQIIQFANEIQTLDNEISKIYEIEKNLAEVEKETEQLKIDFQEMANQEIKTGRSQNAFRSLKNQIVEVNEYLKKIYVASISQANKIAEIEEQQSLNNNNLAYTQRDMPYIQDKGGRVYAEFLYWKNIEPHLSYAIRETPPNKLNPTTEEVSLIGSIKSVEYDWNAGLRVGLGYRWGASSWDLYLDYTHFINKGHDSHTREPSGDIPPYHFLKGMFVEFLGADIYQVKSKTTLNYNIWDLVLQRPFYESPSVIMRFLMGLKGASISQNWHSIYFADNLVVPFETIKNKWEFKGGGPRAGINLEWLWRYGLGLHFQASGGLVLGWFDNKQMIAQAKHPIFGVYQIGKIHPKNGRMIPATEIMIGLQWGYLCKKWGVHLFADWEFNNWIDLNETYYFSRSDYDAEKVGSWMKESVSLQGLTVGLKLDF